MCEFCTKHGEGKIWYKNAANYAGDLLSDLRRRSYIQHFLESTMAGGIISLGRLETVFREKKKLPGRIVRAMEEKARQEHFGQVVPIEDVRGIVEKAASIARIPCACRWTADKKEYRCCYLVSYSPETWFHDLDMGYFGAIETDGLETVTAEEAVNQMAEQEMQGFVHTIWTMITPFIGAICNCTGHDCLGLRTLAMNVQTLARAEYVARVESSLCNGCGLCEPACQFDAISGTVDGRGRNIASVNVGKCYGCGLCRIHCSLGALALVRV